jgi:hypothetical protein
MECRVNIFKFSILPCLRPTEPTPKAGKPAAVTSAAIGELQKAAVGAFAAFTIAGSAVLTAPPPATAALSHFSTGSTTITVAEKVVREGIYGEYEIDVQPQKYDDARSTFKAASETKSKKGTWKHHIRVGPKPKLGCSLRIFLTVG